VGFNPFRAPPAIPQESAATAVSAMPSTDGQNR
jgi:hypothetical protein